MNQILRVSKCHGLTVVRPHTIFLTLRKILKFVCANQKFMHFNPFYTIFFMIHTYYVTFVWFFALVCAQNVISKVLTAPKNLLLECLQILSIV